MFSGFRRRVLFLTLKNKLLFCSEEGKLTKVCLWFLRESQQEVKPDRLSGDCSISWQALSMLRYPPDVLLSSVKPQEMVHGP